MGFISRLILLVQKSFLSNLFITLVTKYDFVRGQSRVNQVIILHSNSKYLRDKKQSQFMFVKFSNLYTHMKASSQSVQPFRGSARNKNACFGFDNMQVPDTNIADSFAVTKYITDHKSKIPLYIFLKFLKVHQHLFAVVPLLKRYKISRLLKLQILPINIHRVVLIRMSFLVNIHQAFTYDISTHQVTGALLNVFLAILINNIIVKQLVSF